MLELYFDKKSIEAGCDEAGRGCLAGPVFAAAVILPKDFACEELNDSKKLTEKKRYELRPYIEKNAIAFAVGIVDNTEIDRMNILRASIEAMHRAIKQLSVRPESLLIDGNRFYKYENIPHHCIVKGDGKYLAIAAASVLAKTYRDDYMIEMDAQYPEYGWKINKGYPTVKHRQAITLYGQTPLHRLSFKCKDSQLDLFNSEQD